MNVRAWTALVLIETACLLGGCPVSLPSVNLPPNACAQSITNALVGDVIQLDAGCSSDTNGDTLTYHWTQTAGARVELTNSQSPIASIVANETGAYRFAVTVSDGRATDSQSIDVVVATSGEATGSPVPDPDHPALVIAASFADSSRGRSAVRVSWRSPEEERADMSETGRNGVATLVISEDLLIPGIHEIAFEHTAINEADVSTVQFRVRVADYLFEREVQLVSRQDRAISLRVSTDPLRVEELANSWE